MGRPKVANPRGERIAVYLSESELALVDSQIQMAAQQGVTVSRSEAVRAGWLLSTGTLRDAAGRVRIPNPLRAAAMDQFHADVEARLKADRAERQKRGKP